MTLEERAKRLVWLFDHAVMGIAEYTAEVLDAFHEVCAEQREAIVARVNAVLAEARADTDGTEAEHIVDELQDDIPAAIRRRSETPCP